MFASYYSKTRLWRCNLLDKYYYQVDTYFLSSKKCSHCEVIIDKTKDLGVRNWTYINSWCKNDRDINTSINIMFEGLKIYCQNS